MKISNIYVLSILMTSFIGVSCENLIIDENEENTPQKNFDLLWTELNEGYTYFEFKNVDWDQVKLDYQSQISDDMSDEELFDLLGSMLKTLRDGHTGISSSPINQTYFDVQEGFEENFNKQFVIDQYLLPNDMDTTDFIRHCYLDEGSIGYLYYSTFTNEITENGMDEILSKYQDTKGLIIDVRGNRGGDASNIMRLMERFVLTPTLLGYSQKKNGPGRNDFTEPAENNINNLPNAYEKPVVVLTNRGCYSACNTFTAYMSLLDNVTIIGDRSGGGAGLPVGNQLWNGWNFTYSASLGYLPDGTIYEDGIEPDILVHTDETLESQGLDNIIEQAIRILQ